MYVRAMIAIVMLAGMAAGSDLIAATNSRSKIACTVQGCRPVPTGCTPIPGRDWDGGYSGFDDIVCR